MTSYKANHKNEVYHVLFYVAIVIGSVAISKKPMMALYAGGIFIPLAVAYTIFLVRLNEIQLDKKKGKLIAIYSSYFWKKKEALFDITNLEFTYKRGDTFKHDEKKSVLILFDTGKEILKLKTDTHGWNDEAMYNLIVELQKLGVKRKFTGYMLNDAEV